MTEHFLNNPKVSPVLDQMRREGVPECVWRYVFPYSGFQGIGLNHLEYGNSAQDTQAAVDEQDVVILCSRPHSQVGFECVSGHLSQGYDPLLVTFAYDP